MRYYNINLDFTKPMRQKITVPTGEKFAIKFFMYHEGKEAKTFSYKVNSTSTTTKIISPLRASPYPTQENYDLLINNNAASINPNQDAGEYQYLVCYFKSSDVVKTSTFVMVLQGIYYLLEDGTSGWKQLNPSPEIYIDIEFVQSSELNGPDYDLNLIGGATMNSLSSTNLSGNYFNLSPVSASIIGKDSFTFDFHGMQLGNRNGIIELSGNVCFNQDFVSDATKSSAKNVLFLNSDKSQCLGIKEVTIGNETLSVLYAKPCS